MTYESDIIIALCADFADDCKPLTRAAFWNLYHLSEDNINNMLTADDEQIAKLMERTEDIAFLKERLNQMEVQIITVKDKDFPSPLSEKLGNFCPPLLYCSGDLNILKSKFMGCVGSRSIDDPDILWTEQCLQNNLKSDYALVTGGAKGIDSVAAKYALNRNTPTAFFLPDNLKEKLKDSIIKQHIYEGKLLLLSHVSPLAFKTRHSFVAAAMERNRFIFALSKGTVVVRSELKKGGAWGGALDALKHNWTNVFVWDNKNYPGNQALIEMGAQALSGDGKRIKTAEKIEQIRLFD